MVDYKALLEEAAAASMADDSSQALALVEPHSQSEAAPATLHFFLGSEYASLKRHDEARTQLLIAVTKAPDYHIARFQLGMMWLTAGHADEALQTWGPLEALPAQHYLNLYRAAMTALATDQLAECLQLLAQAAEANDEIEALNVEMSRFIAPVRAAIESHESQSASSDPVTVEDAEAMNRMLIARYTSRKLH